MRLRERVGLAGHVAVNIDRAAGIVAGLEPGSRSENDLAVGDIDCGRGDRKDGFRESSGHGLQVMSIGVISGELVLSNTQFK